MKFFGSTRTCFTNASIARTQGAILWTPRRHSLYSLTVIKSSPIPLISKVNWQHVWHLPGNKILGKHFIPTKGKTSNFLITQRSSFRQSCTGKETLNFSCRQKREAGKRSRPIRYPLNGMFAPYKGAVYVMLINKQQKQLGDGKKVASLERKQEKVEWKRGRRALNIKNKLYSY